MGEAEAQELQRRYFLNAPSFEPRVYWRMTDNWLELSLRFVARDHGMRDLKDAMAREILAAFDEARIEIASATVELVGAPPLRLLPEHDGKVTS